VPYRGRRLITAGVALKKWGKKKKPSQLEDAYPHLSALSTPVLGV